VPDVLTLAVRGVSSPTPSTRRIVLDLGGVRLAYQAGQAASIGLHGQRERRAYSIASAPTDTWAEGAIEFLIRADPGGGIGRHLEGVHEGSRVDFEGPFGAFLLPEMHPDTPLVFVAGGTGLAPLRSLARESRARGHRAPRHLVYSVRDADDVAYRDEVADWTATHGGEAVVTVTRQRTAGSGWSGRRGRIDIALLQRFVSGPTPLCFLCGPSAMVEDLSHMLSHLGVPADHVRTEQWAVDA
jgi:ferredoxin-NADP reductase